MKEKSLNKNLYLILMMEENKYEIRVSVWKQTQRHRTLLFFSTWFLYVPREAHRSQEQKCPCRTESGPGGARGCLKWLHEELIQNMWGQQRATLQSPGPASEYASSYKVREGYLGVRDGGTGQDTGGGHTEA